MLVVELQRSTSAILCPTFLNQASSLAIESHCARQVLAICLVGLKGNPCPRTFHYHATLRVQVQDGWSLLHFRTEIAHVRTFRHVVAIDTWHLGFVIDGEDAAVKLLVVAIELLGHLLVEEPLLGWPGVRMLILTPVQLPTCVGSQFIETAIE